MNDTKVTVDSVWRCKDDGELVYIESDKGDFPWNLNFSPLGETDLYATDTKDFLKNYEFVCDKVDVPVAIGDVWQGRNNEGDIVVSPMSNGLFSYAYTENPTESFEIGAKELCDFFEPKNPKGSNSKEQGRKDDSSKLRYSLLPKGAVNSVVDVLEFGSKKYADNNWQKVPNAKTRYYDAALRHIDSWWQGEKVDSETGLPHLAHAICCLIFLMWFDNGEGLE